MGTTLCEELGPKMGCLTAGLQAMQRPRVQDGIFSQSSLKPWVPPSLSIRLSQAGFGQQGLEI